MCTVYLFLFSLVLCANPTATVGGGREWKCKHNDLKTPKLSYAVVPPSEESADGHRAVRSATYQPIRIHVEYDSALKISLTSQSTRIKATIIPKIVDFFQKTLKVKRMTTNILLSRPCEDEYIQFHPYPACSGFCQENVKCGDVTVPSNQLAACNSCSFGTTNCHSSGTSGTGIPGADFALYVSFTSSEDCDESTLAYSSYCALEPSLDRPVAGYINFCPLALESEQDDNQIITVAMHELTHTLSFSHLLIPFWRDSSGSPCTPRSSSTNLPPTDFDGVFQASESTIKIQSKFWETYNGYESRSAHYLVTESVKRETRTHYGCPTASGLELEYEGGAGSRFSHWEKRLVENELMSPSLSKNTAVGPSRLTLAVYEDSGWYQVDYSAAATLRFGQDLGCNFLDVSCLTWLKSYSRHTKQPYCLVDVDQVNKSRDCTFDRQSVARCAVFRWVEAVENTFQYFSDPMIYGFPFFSYCPVPLDRGSIEGALADVDSYSYHDSRCRMSENQPNYRFNKFAEDYSAGSRCINHGTSQSWRVNGKTMSDTGGGCYKYFCTGSGLVVSVLGVNYTCPCEGKEIAFDINYSNINYHVVGSLICPACKDVCWDTPQSCPSQEASQCYGEVLHTPAVTRSTCVGQPFCIHQPGPLCDNTCANGGTCSSSGTCVCTAGFTGPSCDTVVCTPTCLNGGTCYKLTSSSTARCDCPSGYYGSYCQSKVVCSPACQNGGTCSGSEFFAYCDCPSGYSGSYCQNKVVCTPTCLNGGTCHKFSSSSTTYCDCPSGYYGSYCQSKVTCSPACQNGGTCSGSEFFAYCDCPSGYSGSYCQNKVHVTCSPACLNGGTCIGSEFFGECDCPSGYSGSYCQYKVNCIPSCQNGGTCHKTSTAAHCACPSGYTGSYCQSRVTCSPACQNGGTCNKTSTTAHCDCPSGYTGSYCQSRITCSPACQNGGTCHKTSTTAHCNCSSGYTGSYCQYKVSCTLACRNGGTCIATSSNSSCVCPSGYTGSYCQYGGTCTPSCQNEGICTDGYCDCPTGYEGSHCQYEESSGTSTGTVGWIAGIAIGSLLVGCCIFTSVGVLIRIGLKHRGRRRQVPLTRTNVTHRGRLHVRAGPLTTEGATGSPPSVTSQDVPLLGVVEEEEVEDDHHDISAAPGVNPLLDETDDEQPLLPK